MISDVWTKGPYVVLVDSFPCFYLGCWLLPRVVIPLALMPGSR